MGIYLKW